MSSLRRRIRLAFGGKKPEVVQSVRFSEVESHIDRLRDSEEASRDYSLLIKSYEEFMEQLDEVKAELDVLQENGEKRFTRIAFEILNGIGSMDRSDLSSFRQFYDNTAQAILSFMKVPGVIQRRTLRYNNGRETIDALNSLLKSFRNLKKVSSKVFAEDRVLKHYRIIQKKYRELQEAFKKKEDLQKMIVLREMEMEEKRRELGEVNAKLLTTQSEIDNDEIVEAKRRVASVDHRTKQIDSNLKLNLRRGMRPIRKILYSEDKRLFEFYKTFSKYPLANINERFWEMIIVLEKQNISLGEKEKKDIDDFVNFCTNRLKDMIAEYEDARAERNKSEKKFNEIVSRSKELLEDLELQKETKQNDFESSSKRLDGIVKQKKMQEADIEKNWKILEKMLSTFDDTKVKIEFD